MVYQFDHAQLSTVAFSEVGGSGATLFTPWAWPIHDGSPSSPVLVDFWCATGQSPCSECMHGSTILHLHQRCLLLTPLMLLPFTSCILTNKNEKASSIRSTSTKFVSIPGCCMDAYIIMMAIYTAKILSSSHFDPAGVTVSELRLQYQIVLTMADPLFHCLIVLNFRKFHAAR